MVQFASEMQFPYKNISLISDFQHILSDVNLSKYCGFDE
jgi:hypothetical protein